MKRPAPQCPVEGCRVRTTGIEKHLRFVHKLNLDMTPVVEVKERIDTLANATIGG